MIQKSETVLCMKMEVVFSQMINTVQVSKEQMFNKRIYEYP